MGRRICAHRSTVRGTSTAQQACCGVHLCIPSSHALPVLLASTVLPCCKCWCGGWDGPLPLLGRRLTVCGCRLPHRRPAAPYPHACAAYVTALQVDRAV